MVSEVYMSSDIGYSTLEKGIPHICRDVPYYLAYSPWGSIRIQALPLGLYPGAAPWAYSRTKQSLRATISKFVFTYKPTEIQAACKSLPKKTGSLFYPLATCINTMSFCYRKCFFANLYPNVSPGASTRI